MVGDHVIDLLTNKLAHVIEKPTETEVVLEVVLPKAQGGGTIISHVTRKYWEVSRLPSFQRRRHTGRR